MKPDEKAKQVEEEIREVKEQEKKPYTAPTLVRLAALEEITEGFPSQTS
jgi:hypothetical protein